MKSGRFGELPRLFPHLHGILLIRDEPVAEPGPLLRSQIVTGDMVGAGGERLLQIVTEIRPLLPGNRVDKIAVPVRELRLRNEFNRLPERLLAAVAPERVAELRSERLHAETDPVGEAADQLHLFPVERLGVCLDRNLSRLLRFQPLLNRPEQPLQLRGGEQCRRAPAEVDGFTGPLRLVLFQIGFNSIEVATDHAGGRVGFGIESAVTALAPAERDMKIVVHSVINPADVKLTRYSIPAASAASGKSNFELCSAGQFSPVPSFT